MAAAPDETAAAGALTVATGAKLELPPPPPPLLAMTVPPPEVEPPPELVEPELQAEPIVTVTVTAVNEVVFVSERNDIPPSQEKFEAIELAPVAERVFPELDLKVTAEVLASVTVKFDEPTSICWTRPVSA